MRKRPGKDIKDTTGIRGTTNSRGPKIPKDTDSGAIGDPKVSSRAEAIVETLAQSNTYSPNSTSSGSAGGAVSGTAENDSAKVDNVNSIAGERVTESIPGKAASELDIGKATTLPTSGETTTKPTSGETSNEIDVTIPSPKGEPQATGEEGAAKELNTDTAAKGESKKQEKSFPDSAPALIWAVLTKREVLIPILLFLLVLIVVTIWLLVDKKGLPCKSANTRQECPCPNASKGSQLCQPNLTWGECECKPPATCAKNTRQNCLCGDEAKGWQECDSEGQWKACTCTPAIASNDTLAPHPSSIPSPHSEPSGSASSKTTLSSPITPASISTFRRKPKDGWKLPPKDRFAPIPLESTAK